MLSSPEVEIAAGVFAGVLGAGSDGRFFH